MKLVSPRVLQDTLRRHGLKPNPRLGQNFLIDGNILDKLIETIEPQPGDLVVEVGPGAGALTQALAQAGAYIVALEIDRGFVSLLEEVLEPYERVTILMGDAGREDLAALASHYRAKLGAKSVKFASNLPYYASSRLLYGVLRRAGVWDIITVMLQREAAERIRSSPGDPSYGELSVFAQAAARAEIKSRVPPRAFWPTPEVESAIVAMVPRKEPMYAACEEEFSMIVQEAFAQRRKTLANAFRRLGLTREEAQEFLFSMGMESGTRGETLSAEEFARLALGFKARKP